MFCYKQIISLKSVGSLQYLVVLIELRPAVRPTLCHENAVPGAWVLDHDLGSSDEGNGP